MDYNTTRRRRQQARPGHNGQKETKFGLVPIQLIPVEKLRPSPENNELYRPVDPSDPEIIALADSIRELNGIQEPLIVTADGYIVSGHRRFAAAILAGLKAVPCRVLDFRKDEDHPP